MALVVAATIEIEISVHCRRDLMVVHRILGLSKPQFDELLRNDTFSKVASFSTLSLA